MNYFRSRQNCYIWEAEKGIFSLTTKNTPSETGAASHFRGFVLRSSHLKAEYFIKDDICKKSNYNIID